MSLPGDSFRSLLNGFHYAFVCPASTDVAIHVHEDSFSIRMRRAIEEGDRRENHPRRAVAALEGFYIKKGLLHGMQGLAMTQTFYGCNLLPGGSADLHAAGTHSGSFNQNGAGAALAFPATVLRTGEPDPIAEHIEENLLGGSFHVLLHTVD
jgi:hypothetical protein